MCITYFVKALEYVIDSNENPLDAIMDIISRDERRLVDIWKSPKGYLWCQRCSEIYPKLHGMMQRRIRFGELTWTVLERDLNVCGQDLGALKNMVCLKYGLGGIGKRDLGEFISAIVSKYGMYNAHLACKDIRTYCESLTVNGEYTNALDRVRLLTNAPHPLKDIGDDMAEMKHLRALFLARRFANILMRRAGIKVVKARRAKPVEALSTEILLLALGIEASIYDDENHKGRETGNITLVPRSNWISAVSSLVNRKALAIWRSPWPIQIIVPCLAALIIGLLHGTQWNVKAFAGNIVMAVACLGVLSSITHARTFPVDSLMMRRDVEAGVNVWAYFIGYNIVDLIWVMSMPLVFGGCYYMLTLPTMSFGMMYCIFVMVCWWVSGATYIVSTLHVGLEWQNLIAVFLSVIFGAFVNGINPNLNDAKNNVFEQFILYISYSRWALEALVVSEYEEAFRTVPNVVLALLSKLGFCGQTTKDLEASGAASIDLILRGVRDIRTLQNEGFQGKCESYVTRALVALLIGGAACRLVAGCLFALRGRMRLWTLAMKKVKTT